MKFIFRLLFLLLMGMPLMSFASASIQLADKNISRLKQFTFVGPANPNKTINVIVWLQLRNKQLFDKTLKEIYTPGSKMYHHYVTGKQFASTYFLTDENINDIKKYFNSQQLAVKPAKNYHFIMRVKGTVAQIERAFKVKMNMYRYHNKLFYANAQAPSIPLALKPFIFQITGLHNIHFAGSASKCIAPATSPEQSTDSNPAELTGTVDTRLVDASGNTILPRMIISQFIPQGGNTRGYTPAQIEQAYGVNTLVGNGINGAGQTVRIVDSCISSTLSGDFNTFQTANSLSPITTVTLSPTPVAPGNFCQDVSGNEVPVAELTLDVEGVKTMAPGANIIVEWDEDWQTDGFPAAIALQQAIDNAIADNPSWNIISVSHSEPELTNEFPNVDPSLQAANMNGITINISSGDCGDNIGFAGALQVNYPSSSPYVTAVGATGLFLDSNNNYSSEVGWGTNINTSYICYETSGPDCVSYTPSYTAQGPFPLGFVQGTTGGISTVYQAPVWQQNAIGNIHAGGYSGTVASHQCSGSMCRAVPDISIFGESHYPGFEVYISQSCGSQPSPCPQSQGGTSLATPFFSGVLALVNQERQMLGKTSGIGLAAQYLYSLPAGTLNIITNPHGMGNPVAGVPNPNAFQLFQRDSSLTGGSPDLIGVVFNSDSSLTLGSQGDRWNDVTGVGSPIATSFVPVMASQ